jgi:hypothetical protein
MVNFSVDGESEYLSFGNLAENATLTEKGCDYGGRGTAEELPR